MLTVITVCSGNICRSPLASQLLAARLADLGDRVAFRSAGTVARDGDPMHPRAAAWSTYLGGDPDPHQARYLQPARLRGVDLVLAMAREHRTAVVSAVPALTRRSFTMRELARLAARLSDQDLRGAVAAVEDSDAARLRGLLDLLASTRGLVPPVARADDDVVDPIARSSSVFELAARQIDDASGQVERVLRIALGG